MPIGLAALIPAAISGIGKIFSDRAGEKTKSTGTTSQTSSGTTTVNDEFGVEGKGLISQILPLLMQSMRQGGSVDPGISERVAQQRTMGVNQNADAIRDTLTGNAVARGLTYSAPANMARGIAESFRGQGVSDIIGDKAGMDIDIARSNAAERNQGLGLAANLLNILPQTRTVNNTGMQTGNSGSNIQQNSGSWLGDALQLGSNIYSTYKGMQQPQRFNFVPEFNQPPQPAALPNLTPPTLSASLPPAINIPGQNKNPLAGKPMTSSSITYDFPGAN